MCEPSAAGDALVFYNFNEAGEPDPWTLHAGLPVEDSATKWIGSHFFNVPALATPT